MSRDYTIERSKQVDPALQFLAIPREYVLYNPTDDDIEIQWDGETRIIPNKDRVSARSEYWGPAFDSEGYEIAGSLVLRDIFQTDSVFGSEVMIWSAANCIKNVLGIDVKTGVATGLYAKRGLSLLPSNPDRELVNKTAAAGRRRYEEWRLVDARTLINAFDERNVNRQRVGMPAVPPPPEYNEAVYFLQAYADKQKAAATKAVNQVVPYDEIVPPVTVAAYDSALEESDRPTDPAPVAEDSEPVESTSEPTPLSPDAKLRLMDELLQDEEFVKTLRARAIMAGSGKRRK